MPSLSTIVDALLPPTSLAVLALAALLLIRRSRTPTALAVLALVLLSMGAVSRPMLASLRPQEPVFDAIALTGLPPPGPPPGAIVILSAEIVWAEGGASEVGPITLERERAGAALQRATGLPVLVTGGVLGPGPAVGTLMARSMANDFNIVPRWTEAASATTWENAQFSAPLLRADGIDRIYLVTHEWHMRRSLLAFRRAGLDPVPVVVRREQTAFEWRALLPRPSAWQSAYFAVHEWVGLVAYSLRQ